MKQPNILIVESSDTLGDTLGGLLKRERFQVERVRTVDGLREFGDRQPPDAILLGPSAIDAAGTLGCVKPLREVTGNRPIILVAAVSSEDLAINALRAGVSEYVKGLGNLEEVVLAIRRCLNAGARSLVAAGDLPPLVGSEHMIGNSAPMRDVRIRIAKVASTDSNVLITGETGTGKELIAELIHSNSRRRDKPLVAINCAAIPDSLFESELFGYEKGAFTGAQHASEGKIKAANGGTVFLDEIGDMSTYGQSKMLRLIESREIQRLGRNSGIDVDVRLVAATNRNLDATAEENGFRKDLFFRLAVTSIHLPPLRERKEDFAALLTHYIRFYNQRFGRSVERFSDRAMEAMFSYGWPGNVRELKNLVEGAFVELPSADVAIAELPKPFYDRSSRTRPASESERDRLLGALMATNWNKSEAANKLHWSRMTLYRKLAQHNINRSRSFDSMCDQGVNKTYT
jgi:DNA-binding NtrC family response regulator